MTFRAMVIVLSAATLAAPVWAQQHGHGAHGAASAQDAAQVAAAGDMTDAEVRKLDRANGKVTLKHGEIRNLQMPPMTMVFEVKEPALLDKLKQGEKVRFKAEQINGTYTVTAVEPSK